MLAHALHVIGRFLNLSEWFSLFFGRNVFSLLEQSHSFDNKPSVYSAGDLVRYYRFRVYDESLRIFYLHKPGSLTWSHVTTFSIFYFHR